MTMALLPDFPWDSLAPYKERASSHVGGLVDLSVGTPVDPTPEVVRAALAGAADAPGYPQTWGTPGLREAVAAWFARRAGCPGLDPDGVLPTIGSKELVAWLPTLLGIGAGDVVGFPERRLPDVRRRRPARRGDAAAVDGLTALGPLTSRGTPKLLWLNSPSNPTGRSSASSTSPRSSPGPASTAWSWPATSATPSSTGAGTGATRADAQHPRPAGLRRQPRGPARRLLAVQAVQPRRLPGRVRRRRPGAGAPAARGPQARRDDRARGRCSRPWSPRSATTPTWPSRRRGTPRGGGAAAGVEAAGYRVDHSDAGLYLWATRGEDALGPRRRAGGPRHPGGPRHLLRGGRSRARAHRPHRHRRAHRRRGRAAAGDAVPIAGAAGSLG